MKKIISLVIIFLLIFSLVSCKSHGSDEETAYLNEETAYPKQEETPAQNENIIDTVPDETEDTVNNTTTDNQQPTDEQVTPENKPDDNVTDNTHVNVTDENSTASTGEQANDIQEQQKDDVNQLEIDANGKNKYGGDDTDRLKFKSVEEMIECIKDPEKFTGDLLQEASDEAEYNYYLQAQANHEKNGGKGDFRFKHFNTADIKYFYKTKDIPGYTLWRVEVSATIIRLHYTAADIEGDYDNNSFHVTYCRPDDFVTDSYFDDYIEYYKIGKENIMDDKYVYRNYEKDGYSSIMFAVENTIIQIFGETEEFFSYEALKKLCVPEKVVIR